MLLQKARNSDNETCSYELGHKIVRFSFYYVGLVAVAPHMAQMMIDVLHLFLVRDSRLSLRQFGCRLSLAQPVYDPFFLYIQRHFRIRNKVFYN